MGADCSETQAKLIVDLVKPNGKVWVIPDGNEAGRRCAKSVLEQISPHRFCRWIPLAKDKQPTDYVVDELLEVMGTI
jgi:DNA primase